MYMADWIAKLDDFLKLSDREILRHVGTVSHETATARAIGEYERFRADRVNLPSAVERHFEAAVLDLHRLEKARAKGEAKGKANVSKRSAPKS